MKHALKMILCVFLVHCGQPEKLEIYIEHGHTATIMQRGEEINRIEYSQVPISWIVESCECCELWIDGSFERQL